MTTETVFEQSTASKPSIAAGALAPNAPIEASLQATALGKYRVIRRNRQLTPFDGSKIRVAIANKTLAVMAVLVFSVFCSEAEAGCGGESKPYVQQTPNISEQAQQCTEERGNAALEKSVVTKIYSRERSKVSSTRLEATATKYPPQKSVTINVWESTKDHLWKVLPFLGIILMIREKLVAGSILSTSGTFFG